MAAPTSAGELEGRPLPLPTERTEAAIAAGRVELPQLCVVAAVGACSGENVLDDSNPQDVGRAEADTELERDDDDGADEARLLDRLRSECAWEVVVADCAWRQWRARKGLDAVLRRDVLRKLIRIASGQRGARLSKRIALSPAPQAQLFESYLCVRGWRMLWEEVVGVSGRDGRVRDQILLWGVFSHDGTEARIRYIEEKIQGRPLAQLRPAARPADATGARLPREFADDLPLSSPGRRYLFAASLYPDESLPAATGSLGGGGRGRDREADHQVLAEVRAEAAAVALLPLAGGADFPNEIAAREQRGAVGAAWPCLVNGRPGTGKTSCAALRLWAGHRAYWGRSRGARLLSRDGHYRSVFLAASAALCREVRAAFCRLRRAENASMRAVVTRDAAAAAVCFSGAAALARAGRLTAAQDEEVDGMGADDDALAAGASLAALDEAAFPLFLTRDRFLRMLNGALDRPFDLTSEGERLLTAARFQSELWPELCTAGRDELRAIGSDAAWLEIVSHIRGSLDALLSPDGCLSEAQYLELGRMQSTLDERQRRAVYALHARYEQLKRSPRHARHGRPLFDHMDLVHHVFWRLRAGGYRGPALHEAYVDEVQDFTAAEVGTVAAFMGDSRALWLSGDSAQAIARGVSFRFADLKQLLRPEVERELYGHVCTPAGHTAMRYLTQNYRSHAGIVGLASTVLDVLEVLFPGALDRLPRDSGIRAGEPPVAMRSGSEDALEAFLFGSAHGSADRRLGAEQVVLVRTGACKARVPAFLRSGVVLTVEEAKGLEFDSVLLLNFFRDSRAEEHRLWREALKACEDEVIARATAAESSQGGEPSQKVHGPDPSAPQMQAMALALRLLYTAVTRAREQVWIFDADGATRGAGATCRQALISLLHKCRAVQDETTAGTAPRRAESTAADWRRKAREYERLGLLDAADRADAIAAKLDVIAAAAATSVAGKAAAQPTAYASSKLSKSPKTVSCNARSELLDRAKRALNRAKERKNQADRAEDLHSAASLFEQAGELARAAKTYLDSGDHARAAELYDRAGQPAEAWSVWYQSGRWADAAAYYEARGDATRALELLDGRQMWSECFALVQRHPSLWVAGSLSFGGAEEELPPNVSSRRRGLAFYAYKCCLPLIEAVGADLDREPPPPQQLAALSALVGAVSSSEGQGELLEVDPDTALLNFLSSPNYPSLLRSLTRIFGAGPSQKRLFRNSSNEFTSRLWERSCRFYRSFDEGRRTIYKGVAQKKSGGADARVVVVGTSDELYGALQSCNAGGGRESEPCICIVLRPGRYLLSRALAISTSVSIQGGRTSILDASALPDSADVIAIDGWKAPVATKIRRRGALSYKVKDVKATRVRVRLAGFAVEDARPARGQRSPSSTISVRGPAYAEVQGCTVLSQRSVCIDVSSSDCEPPAVPAATSNSEPNLESYNVCFIGNAIRGGSRSVAVRVRQSRAYFSTNEFLGGGAAVQVDVDTISDVRVPMDPRGLVYDEGGPKGAAGVLFEEGAAALVCDNYFGPGFGCGIRTVSTGGTVIVAESIFVGRDAGVCLQGTKPRTQFCACNVTAVCAIGVHVKPMPGPSESLATPSSPDNVAPLAIVEDNVISCAGRKHAIGIHVDARDLAPTSNAAAEAGRAPTVFVRRNRVTGSRYAGIGCDGDALLVQNSLGSCERGILLWPSNEQDSGEAQRKAEAANSFASCAESVAIGLMISDPEEGALERSSSTSALSDPPDETLADLESTPTSTSTMCRCDETHARALDLEFEAVDTGPDPIHLESDADPHLRVPCGNCTRSARAGRPCQRCGTLNVAIAIDPSAMRHAAYPLALEQTAHLFGTEKQLRWLRETRPGLFEKCKVDIVIMGGSFSIEDVLRRLDYETHACPCGRVAFSGLPCGGCGAVRGELRMLVSDNLPPRLRHYIVRVLDCFYYYTLVVWGWTLLHGAAGLASAHLQPLAFLLVSALCLRPWCAGPFNLMGRALVKGVYHIRMARLYYVGWDIRFGLVALSVAIVAGCVTAKEVLIAMAISLVWFCVWPSQEHASCSNSERAAAGPSKYPAADHEGAADKTAKAGASKLKGASNSDSAHEPPAKKAGNSKSKARPRPRVPISNPTSTSNLAGLGPAPPPLRCGCGGCAREVEQGRPCPACGTFNAALLDPDAPWRPPLCLFGTERQLAWLREARPEVYEACTAAALELGFARVGVEPVLLYLGYSSGACPPPCGRRGVRGLPCGECGASGGTLARYGPLAPQRSVRRLLDVLFHYALVACFLGAGAAALRLCSRSLASAGMAALLSFAALSWERWSRRPGAPAWARLLRAGAFSAPLGLLLVLFEAFKLARFTYARWDYRLVLAALAAALAAGFVSPKLLSAAAAASFALVLFADAERTYT
eukprot:tig00000545_g2017.t1